MSIWTNEDGRRLNMLRSKVYKTDQEGLEYLNLIQKLSRLLDKVEGYVREEEVALCA